MSPVQEGCHQHVQPSLPLASVLDHTAVSVPAHDLAAVSLLESRPLQQESPSASLFAVPPIQPQHGMAPTQDAQEHAAAQRPDTGQTRPPASYAHALPRPSRSFQPSPQQAAAAQSGMLQPFPGSGAQAGIRRTGGSPQQRLAQPGQAGQMGVLQSGSSEELARALADLTQMVSCARSDHVQGASPGAACPAQPPSLNALLVPARTGQRLPGQQQAAPHQQHVFPPQVHAEQQMSQHRRPEPRLELSSIKCSSGPQISAAVRLQASAIQRQGTQQPATPVVAQQQPLGHDHDSKRKRDSSQVCTVPEHPGQPPSVAEDTALPSKRAKLYGNPSQMEHTATQMPPLQTQAGPCVPPAGISHGEKSPPTAQARSLHATLRCAPNLMPYVTVLKGLSMHA